MVLPLEREKRVRVCCRAEQGDELSGLDDGAAGGAAHPTHPQGVALGMLSPDLHTFQPGLGAESPDDGETRDKARSHCLTHRERRDSSEPLQEGKAPGALISQALSLMGHSH